jgi:hypothetical protein
MLAAPVETSYAQAMGRIRRALVVAIAFAVAPSTGAAQQTAGDPRTGPTATVTGFVYDSITRAFLGGVMVQYVDADDSAQSRAFSVRSDSSGRYRIADVKPGRYLAGFFHTETDTLGLETGARVIDVRSGEQRIDLATRSPTTVIASVCPAGAVPDSTGLLIGHVRDSDTDAPIVGASVVVEWSETVIEGANVSEHVARLGQQTHGPGWFAICGVPSDALLSGRASRGADSSGTVMVHVPSGEVRHITFLVGGATVVPAPGAAARDKGDSLARPRTMLRGGARLTGTVRDEKGRPVQNAHALVWGTEMEVLTNDRGVFSLDSLPGGTHTLEVRAVRHAPAHAIVQLSAQRPGTASVTLTQSPTVLSSVTVRGELVYSKNLTGFDERRGEGWGLLGHFLAPAEIERRPRTRLGNLLQGMSGVFVDSRRSGATVRMRTTGDPNSYCTPSLYIDGTPDMEADFNSFQSDQIAGVEVYVREAWRPSEFLDGNACGAVVVWTRPIPPKKNP